MMRRIISSPMYVLNFFLYTGLVLALCSCSIFGSNDGPKIDSYQGTWRTADFQAEITATGITVFWINEDTRSLYWVGTFAGEKHPKENDDIQSTGDVEQMKESIMGSQDDTKFFKFKDNTLNFQMSAVGVTQTIHLVKQP